MARFRGANNKHLTEQLFEEGRASSYTPIYNLGDEHTETTASLKVLYLEMEDIYEVQFADTYFDGYEHWKKVAESRLVKPHITKWREELELKLMSYGLAVVKTLVKDDTSKLSLAAAKMILDRCWDKSVSKLEGRGAGRPKKEKLDEQLYDLTSVEADFKRLVNVN